MACKTEFLDHVTIPKNQIHTLNESLLNNPEAAAKEYQSQIQSLFGTASASFSLVLLGLGPDGHTCSLFPKHTLLDESVLLISHITDSPKLPSCRITFTYRLLNNAKVCLFVATGQGKADMLKEILEEKRDYPATRVGAKIVDWLIDDHAAAKLAL